MQIAPTATPEKVMASIRESFEAGSNLTVEREAHSLKQDWPSFSTEKGRQIDSSRGQNSNAESSTIDSFDPDSNVTIESPQHALKHDWPMCSTEDGMQIDESEKHFSNAQPSMHQSLQPDSNTTLDNDGWWEKQYPSNRSILFATKTDGSFPKYALIEVQSKSKR
jgi:hypothetical protein